MSTPLRQLGSSAALVVGVAVLLASPGPSRAHSTSYLAPVGYCTGTPTHAMLCLHDYARHQAGLLPFHAPETLMRAARAKSADVARCGFSHTACGHPFTYRIDWAGYRWTRVGENIAYGSGSPMPSPRAIFAAWLRSTGHRANILNPAFQDIGVASHPGTFGGATASFWVAEFGRH